MRRNTPTASAPAADNSDNSNNSRTAMAYTASQAELERLAAQLEAFYRKNDGGRVPNVRALLRKYSLAALSSRLMNRYGEVPEGWGRLVEKSKHAVAPRVGGSSGSSSTAAKKLANTAKSEGGEGRGRKFGANFRRNKATVKPSLAATSSSKSNKNNRSKRNLEMGDSSHVGSAPNIKESDAFFRNHNIILGNTRTVHTRTPGVPKLDPTGVPSNLYQDNSDNEVDGDDDDDNNERNDNASRKSVKSNTSKKRNKSNKDDERGFTPSPPPDLLKYSAQRETDRRKSNPLRGSVVRIQKYVDLMNAGVPTRSLENKMVEEGDDPDATIAQLLQVMARQNPPPPPVPPRTPPEQQNPSELKHQHNRSSSISSLLWELEDSAPTSVIPPPPPPPVDPNDSDRRSSIPSLSWELEPQRLRQQQQQAVSSSQAKSRLSHMPLMNEPPPLPLEAPNSPAPAQQRISARVGASLLTAVAKTDQDLTLLSPPAPRSRTSAPRPGEVALPVQEQMSTPTKATVDDAVLAKYRCMLTVGLSQEAVEHSMVRDGVDPSLLSGSGDGGDDNATDDEKNSKDNNNSNGISSTSSSNPQPPPRPSNGNAPSTMSAGFAKSTPPLPPRPSGGSAWNRPSKSTTSQKPPLPPRKNDSSSGSSMPSNKGFNDHRTADAVSRNNGSSSAASVDKKSKLALKTQPSQGILALQQRIQQNMDSSSKPLPTNKPGRQSARNSGFLTKQNLLRNFFGPKDPEPEPVKRRSVRTRNSGFAAKQQALMGIFGGSTSGGGAGGGSVGEGKPVEETRASARIRQSGFAAASSSLAGLFGPKGTGPARATSNDPRKFKWATPSEREEQGNAGAPPSARGPNPAPSLILDQIRGATASSTTAAPAPAAPAVPHAAASQARMQGAPSPSPPTALPANAGVWHEIWSLQYGCSYFFNSQSGRSTWSEPPAGSVVKLMDTSGGWLLCWSDEYNRCFYHNPSTKTSTWKPPASTPARPSTATTNRPAPVPTAAARTKRHAPVPPSTPKSGSPKGQKSHDMEFVVAQFAFTPKANGSPEEMSLLAGEVVQVLEKSGGDGWWRGRRVRDGQAGLFPVSYVQWL